MGAIISFHQVNKSQALYEETRQALVETLTALEEECWKQTVRLAMLKAWMDGMTRSRPDRSLTSHRHAVR
jgi:hypothetical protein